MAGSNLRDYETLYGVGLLDDLHNYFPGLLYEPEQFRSVAQVLMYVQRQTHRRFDLFTFGQTAYNERRAPLPVPVPVPILPTMNANPPPMNPVAPPPISSSVSIPLVSQSLRGSSRVSLLQQAAPSMYEQEQGQEEEEEEEEFEQVHQMIMGMRSNGRAIPLQNNNATIQLLSALLNLPTLPSVNTNSFPAGFLNPVVVRPTQEQITSSTTLTTLETLSTENCAICQDNITAQSEQREINHCHHTFHRGCIDTWFQQNVHCPVCRHDIRENSSQEET